MLWFGNLTLGLNFLFLVSIIHGLYLSQSFSWYSFGFHY